MGCELVEDGEEIVGAEEFVLFAFDLDFGAAVFAHEDAVAHFDFKGDFLAVVIGFAQAEGANDSFLGLFLGGIGMMMPPFLTSFSSTGSTRTRSPRGFTFSAI